MKTIIAGSREIYGPFIPPEYVKEFVERLRRSIDPDVFDVKIDSISRRVMITDYEEPLLYYTYEAVYDLPFDDLLWRVEGLYNGNP